MVLLFVVKDLVYEWYIKDMDVVLCVRWCCLGFYFIFLCFQWFVQLYIRCIDFEFVYLLVEQCSVG